MFRSLVTSHSSALQTVVMNILAVMQSGIRAVKLHNSFQARDTSQTHGYEACRGK
jgi:hypothetical protein